MEQAIFKFSACYVVEQHRVEFALLGPQRVKLGFNHGAINVEVVAFFYFGFAVVLDRAVFAITRTDRQALLVASMEPLTHRAAPGGVHGLAQLAYGFFECAAVVVGFVGFAIAFEAASLVDVEQRARILLGQQCMVQPFGTQDERVFGFKGLASGLVLREESMAQQSDHHSMLAFQQSIATSAHGPGFTPTYRQ